MATVSEPDRAMLRVTKLAKEQLEKIAKANAMSQIAAFDKIIDVITQDQRTFGNLVAMASGKSTIATAS